MRAKKQFGQHFLTSQSALRKIIEAGNVTTEDTVLEIGPGRGVLTEALLEKAKKVIAVEKDVDLIPVLQEKFTEALRTGKLEILQEDILKISPDTFSFSYKLIANIPYYITGAIFEQFLSSKKPPTQMVVLVQKEVAERAIAKDGKESILSISVKAYGTPKIIAKVPAGSFSPPPKVDSAILSIENINRSFFTTVNENFFFEVLKTAFGQKRKTITRTLGDKYGTDMVKEILSKVNLDEKARPETITLQKWQQLATELEKVILNA